MCKIGIRGIFLISIAVLLISNFSYPQIKDVSSRDGTDWLENNSFSEGKAHNLGLIAGIIEGTSLIHDALDTYLKMSRPVEDITNPTNFDHIATIDYVRGTLQDVSLFDITIGQIKDGIDAFYQDFGNRRIKIIDAVYVIKMQIEGKDPDWIQMQIRYLRMQPLSTKAMGEATTKILEIQKKRRIEKKIYSGDFTNEDLKNGVVTEQDLLYGGIFVDKNNVNRRLFCYGTY